MHEREPQSSSPGGGREGPPAYVLAGGKSSRFGSDKARADLGGMPLILRVASVLRSGSREVIAVADVAGKYVDVGLETIADRRPGLGPLAGIEAALADRLERYGAGWVVVASCDMAGLKAEWVTTVVEHLAAAGGANAVAFRRDFWQPFPGGYHTGSLPVVSELLDRGGASFQRLLSDERTNAAAVALPADWPAVVQINTREEFERFCGSPRR